MSGTDYAKALGVAVFLMVLNVSIAYGVVAVYAYLIEPGHEQAFYEAAAQRIAPWSSIFAGIPLFYFASRFLARRAPHRNGATFGLAMAGGYAVVDIAILASAAALPAMLGFFAASIASKAIAAWLGGQHSGHH